jgi:tetratricopeptide (TPR) repeat protein
MKLYLAIVILLVVVGREAVGQESELATGRAYYTEGEFKKALTHFQLALKVNSNDAESYYWMGMSYQVLADIAFPFGGKYNSQARICLTKALQLAPARTDYRRELFDFLLDSAGSSRTAQRQAADLLRAVPKADPDYDYMSQRFQRERKANASMDARLERLFLAIPRATYRIVELPGSTSSRRRATSPRTPAQRDGVSSVAGTGATDAGVW